MSITTRIAVSGFVASKPKLTRMENGDARIHMKIGQEHYQRQPDGTLTKTPTTVHDLVAYRGTAERAALLLKQGDHFIAEGALHAWQEPTEDGQSEHREEFIARKIGHDLTRTNYTIERNQPIPKPQTPTTSILTYLKPRTT
jgi:single-stranded DNA-binding protein